jgi:hypothetical protein
MSAIYTYYQDTGNQTEDKAAEDVCAYEAKHPTHSNYYVKSYGSFMFNPLEKKNHTYITRNVWQFRKVSLSAFRLYVKFLETKQTTTLKKAEREI